LHGTETSTTRNFNSLTRNTFSQHKTRVSTQFRHEVCKTATDTYRAQLWRGSSARIFLTQLERAVSVEAKFDERGTELRWALTQASFPSVALIMAIVNLVVLQCDFTSEVLYV